MALPLGYLELQIVHLEMLNILAALKIWHHYWANKKVAIACDKLAVVQVLSSCRTRDLTLAAIARNIQFQGLIYLTQITPRLRLGANQGRTHYTRLVYIKIMTFSFNSGMNSLIKQGIQKTHMAFRPATSRNYESMFRLFIAFTIFMKINVCKLSPLALVAYLQFLETNQTSASAIANHLSAIKAKLALLGLSVQPF